MESSTELPIQIDPFEKTPPVAPEASRYWKRRQSRLRRRLVDLPIQIMAIFQ